MALIQFTRNHDDLSTDKGYQFKFYCDKCGNGFMTSFQTSVVGTAGSMLRAAGSIFGGILGQAGNSAYEIQRAVGGPEHDAALRTAVEEARPNFTQCVRCGRWVCNEVCWNADRGLCTECGPKTEVEVAAAQSAANSPSTRDAEGQTTVKSSIARPASRSRTTTWTTSAPDTPRVRATWPSEPGRSGNDTRTRSSMYVPPRPMTLRTGWVTVVSSRLPSDVRGETRRT